MNPGLVTSAASRGPGLSYPCAPVQSVSDSLDPVIWIDPDRLLYAGLLGSPKLRSLGAYVSYLALDAPVEVALGDGPWQQFQVATLPPYVAHRVRCAARRIGIVLVEPETVDVQRLPDWLCGGCNEAAAVAYLGRVRAVCEWLGQRPVGLPVFTDFDNAVFSQKLPAREIDSRIQQVVAAIKRDPCGNAGAEDYARSVQLSFSRFLHLFKAELGIPFRRFRSWHRARHLARRATSNVPLVEIAIEAGYSDSAHFSHSIRQAFGLTPRDILAGSRRLALHSNGICENECESPLTVPA